MAAELHRDGGVRRGADARVDDDGTSACRDDRQVVRVADTEAGADGRRERHDGGAADVPELPADDRIVDAVRKDDEAPTTSVLAA